MNSRERILAALRHKEPDMVPYDLNGTDSSSISGLAYNKLRKHLGLGQGKTQIYDFYGQVCKLEDDVRDILKPDTFMLMKECVNWKPFKLSDGSSCQIPEKCDLIEKDNGDIVLKNDKGIAVAKMPKGGYYFDSMSTPMSEVEDKSELSAYTSYIESYDLPFYADESLESLTARAKKVYEETGLAIILNIGGHLLSAGQKLFGFEKFMIDLMINKELSHAFLDTLTNAFIKRYDQYLDKIGRYIQVVLINDDLGIQTGPMLSLECYKEMIWPYQKRLFEFIKKKANVYILLHSCGSVNKFIPLLIEAGLDALNPIQVTAAGMDTKKLKKEFGKDITFWGGGCNTQQILSNGTVEQVENEVKRRIEDLAPGGGFVFTQVHNIQPEVPPENIMAMYNAYKQYRNNSIR